MTTNTEPYSVHTKKEPTISIASYQPITEKKPWRMTGGENFCKKCMTDKSFFIKNYKTCTDQCVHRFETLIDPSEQTSSSFSSYRSKQIDYYDFLVERECNLAKTWTVEVGEKNRTCFVNGWDEHAFLKLRTQDCGLTNNISLVTLFNMYTLIPYIRSSQINPLNLDLFVRVEQEKLLREFTLCPTWPFPAELFLNLLFQKGRKRRETEEKDETEGGFDEIYNPIISSLHTLWKNTLSKNPDTEYLCGNIVVPGHVISYCMGKTGMREIFDSNGTPNTFLSRKKIHNYKKKPQLEIVTSRVIELENKIIDHILHNPNLNLPNEISGLYFTPLILTIISLAMFSFNPQNVGFFVEEDHPLSLRWPVSVNRKPLQHEGSCAMWCIFYLFLRVLMVKFDSRALQNVFKKFTEKAYYKCVYKAPLHPDPPQRKRKPSRKMDDDDKDPSNLAIAPVLTNVTLCSGDLGLVFWFALFKAFEACVGKRPGSPRVFLECIGDADPNPGVVFINYFCVIRNLLPENVTKTLGCESSEMPQEFYPLVGRELSAATLESLTWSFLISNPLSGVKGLKRIISIGSKILHDPQNSKWREIRLKNELFNKEIGSLKRAMSFMEAVGFTRRTRDDGEKVFYMTNEDVEYLKSSITRLKAALSTFLAMENM